MKKISALAATTLATALATTLAVTSFAAQAQGSDTGNWLVRGRALNLHSENGDTTGLGLSVNNKTFPEVDISYFLTPNLATELILTYPQKHTLYSKGSKIGTLKHLPPTLLLQYHVTGLGGFRPYAGLGVNFTNFSSVQFEPAVVAALKPNVKRTSWGAAVQLGVDIPVGGGWLINIDAKKVKLATDVTSGGTTVGTFTIDPVLFSVGAGLRF